MYTAMAKICTGELVCKIGFAQGICTGICQQGPLGSAIREMDGNGHSKPTQGYFMESVQWVVFLFYFVEDGTHFMIATLPKKNL